MQVTININILYVSPSVGKGNLLIYSPTEMFTLIFSVSAECQWDLHYFKIWAGIYVTSNGHSRATRC